MINETSCLKIIVDKTSPKPNSFFYAAYTCNCIFNKNVINYNF